MEDSLDALVDTPPSNSSVPSSTPTDPPSPTSIRNTSVESQDNGTTSEDIQLEPTQEELERERLIARAEQLQDDIGELRKKLQEKETELYEVKQALGITAFTEMRDGLYNGWKVVGNKWKDLQETETFRKIDSTFVGWRDKLEESERYQKTKQSLSDGGKKASSAISSAATSIKENEKVKTFGTKTKTSFQSAGTAIKNAGTAVKENDRVQNFGERIRTTSVRIKDRIVGSDANTNDDTVAKETVVPDEPIKKD